MDKYLTDKAVGATNLCKVGQLVFGKGLLICDELCDACIEVVVGYELDELGEMVPIPFTNSHGKQIDVLVELVQKSNSLNDHVINPVDIELEL